MFGCNSESAFTSIVERNLRAIPSGVLKIRIVEFSAFLSMFLVKNDPQVQISILTKMMRDSATEATESDLTSDLEALFYLKLVLSSDNSNPLETVHLMRLLKNIMEFKLTEGLSKDSIVRKAQEIFCADNIRSHLNNIPMSERTEIAELLNFFVIAAQESGDLEFSSSLGIIAHSLLMPV